jgi:hypothetical protein
VRNHKLAKSRKKLNSKVERCLGYINLKRYQYKKTTGKRKTIIDARVIKTRNLLRPATKYA